MMKRSNPATLNRTTALALLRFEISAAFDITCRAAAVTAGSLTTRRNPRSKASLSLKLNTILRISQQRQVDEEFINFITHLVRSIIAEQAAFREKNSVTSTKGSISLFNV
jgi:hypothetical protein